MSDPTEPRRSSSADPAVLRLLDANANRAREGLRVLEDYARFVLDDADLCGSIKHLRHELTAAIKPFVAEAILYRDTPGDVGTTVKTTSEMARSDLAEVVVAAGKRLGESLRAIEEYLKTLAPAGAARVERLRYAFYEVERQLAWRLRPARARIASVRLYVLVTEALCRGPWLEAAEAAILGGADCLQLREKDMDSGELLNRARLLVELCRKHRVVSIINDRPDIALLSGADGVHVGQGDLPAKEARRIVGPHCIIGVSTHELAQARQAVADGADYIGVGPFFRSPTKPRDFVAGPAYAREVVANVSIPAFAIAGITEQNVGEVLSTGMRAIAVTSAVLGAADVRNAARELKQRLEAGGFGPPPRPVSNTVLSSSS